MPYCQTFKQRIEEIKRKAQNIEALLSEYVKKVDKKTEEQLEDELEKVKKEIEEFKQEFKTKATQLIEEFIQRRDNTDEKVEIIFDERDGRFIIDGGLDFSSRTHLDDFPNLIKEITRNFWLQKAKTINLPNLEKIGENFNAKNAQTINLPNIKEIGGYIYFNKNNPNFNSLIELAREWREKGILKGKIRIFGPKGNSV
jgi:DNA repair exonuclease SbcCD ATPase subunit